jgi:hypothetical protein
MGGNGLVMACGGVGNGPVMAFSGGGNGPVTGRYFVNKPVGVAEENPSTSSGRSGQAGGVPDDPAFVALGPLHRFSLR